MGRGRWGGRSRGREGPAAVCCTSGGASLRLLFLSVQTRPDQTRSLGDWEGTEHDGLLLCIGHCWGRDHGAGAGTVLRPSNLPGPGLDPPRRQKPN
jgi:hypothetical protein